VTDAHATVTQVDGTILPQSNRLQLALDAYGEGGAPAATALDAVVDAAKVPEIFLPNLATPVVFVDIAETAGFENSFGYYNVGDDLSNRANLHPIMGCGVSRNSYPFRPGSMTERTAAAGYVQNAEPGSTATIDFMVELAAGRYKGGFIGFYLITPQNNPSSDNCGDFVNGSDGLSLFGYIYYTQSDLNDDGDFVHHLVYTSKRTPNRFYFGFEDLFRGGDNDFDDMAMQVTGLTPPCVPTAEVCDGRDNDCDGLVDAADPSLTGVGADCTDTTRQGECRRGRTFCVGAAIVCNSVVSPMAETCNGLDDNCNGVIDDAVPGTGVPCDGPDGDLCNEGVVACTGGSLTCTDTTGTNVETCNGLDDDCNGRIDDGNPGGGAPCDGADTDLCLEGTLTCTGGVLVCVEPPGDAVEVCNGLDDDCNGRVDDGNPGGGAPCSAGVGACRRNGFVACTGGVLACNAVPGPPGTEICNGIDDDCDGAVDEGFGVGAACDGVGACGLGVIECAGPMRTRCSTDPGGSAYVPMPEVCNGVDDDCDGSVDEGLADLGPCGTSVGECAPGRLRCLGGTPVCRGAVGPAPEVCDGRDNDCDGLVDERTGSPGDVGGGLVDEGAACGSSVGACRAGTEVCTAGRLVCTGAVGPTAELCNGVDDDCDGIADDDPTDVGVPCGLTDVGACERGRTICTGGTIVCNGEIRPTFETCNGEDDDCDGVVDDDPIDVGLPCGSALGTCTPGRFVCTAGRRECAGATPGVPEVCNGIDDDCDGVIDDDPSDAGGVCGTDVGVCEPGVLRCIAASLQCVGGVGPGLEVCNGLDDDCDGEVDEGDDLCGGGLCIAGECAVPCTGDEFGCAPGYRCVDGYCLPDPCASVTCAPLPDGTRTVCDEGRCVSVCERSTCAAPRVCRRTDGACVENSCTFLPYLCGDGEVCRAGACVPDPCAGVTCDASSFCRDGSCRQSCADVRCAEGERCVAGACVAASCGDRPCDRACDGVSCPRGEVCDPYVGGRCIADPCEGVRCPTGQVCALGECVRPVTPRPDAGVGVDAGGPDLVVATGGGGCSVGSSPRSGGGIGGAPWWLAIGWLGVLGLRSRRNKRVAALGGGFARDAGGLIAWIGRGSAVGIAPAVAPATVGVLAASLAALVVGGCDVEPYCVDRCGAGVPDGALADGGDGGTTDGGDGAVCVPTDDPTEVCDGLDNDCDGRVDEETDLTRDGRNCGACGVSCAKPGAQTECVASVCRFGAIPCFPGFYDLDGDTVGPFSESNGCEYRCFPSNGGVEACDGLDNDCDGEVDEGFVLASDPRNCGECNRVCAFFNATGRCIDSTCGFDPRTDCEPGWTDANGVQADGCEYPCTPTNGGVEACDGLDNDCDGPADEDFDLPNNVENCGRCGRRCEFPNAVPRCTAGVCGFDPMTDCLPGFSDRNGNQLDGCEYPCVVTNGGVEICDGLDNDCNGVVDGETTDAGGRCNLAPGGTARGVCTDSGTVRCIAGALTCVGAPRPAPEVCNGLDDDCDGMVDDSPVDVGRVCAPSVGVCTAGLSVCTAGVLGCERSVTPSPEVCNGLDDDCDGMVDDSPTDPTLGTTCGSSLGICTAGTVVCDSSGNLVCSGSTPPRLEVCNGLDDDCNGTVDDGTIDSGGSCGSSVGRCVPGTLVCSGGTLTCTGGLGPAPETCNGIDDDCDGSVDEMVTTTCYSGPMGTAGVGACRAGVRTCTAGVFGPCSGEVTPRAELCNGVDDDCDGSVDEMLTQACYTGPPATRGVGRCRDGVRMCVGGTFSGPCTGEVLPVTEVCNGVDDDCDGATDEDAGGGPITQACYTGPPATRGVGTCRDGTRTCAFGALGPCVGEVVPTVDRCGDGLDTDCDGLGDAAEGCLGPATEARIDSGTAGEYHSFDPRVVSQGSPRGTNVYVVWSDLANGASDIFFHRSTDGGATFPAANRLSLTTDTANAAVVPEIAVARNGANDEIHVVYQRVAGGIRSIWIRRSLDGGLTWQTAQQLGGGSGLDTFHHDVAVSEDGQRVAVVWEQLNTSNLQRRVFFRGSTDRGATWGAVREVTVNSGAAPQAGRPRVAITSTGRAVVVWREVRAGRATFDIYANRTDGFDANFVAGNEVRLDGDGPDNRQSDLPQIVVAQQNVYVVWQDVSTLSGGGSDVVFARSTNNGASYSAERILDDPSMEVSSSLRPTIAVDPQVLATATDDRIYVAWEDTREGSQVYFARSLDAGASFAAPVRASNQAPGIAVTGVSRFPRIAFVGGDSLVITYENDRGTGIERIYAASSVDAGVSWRIDDTRLDGGTGRARAPVIAPITGGGAVLGAIVVWADFRSGTRINGDIYRNRIFR
jgi:hypothetical protein